MKRVAVALAGVALLALSTTACDDGPECLRSHTTLQLIPVFNGKTTTMVLTPVEVCDEYAKETPK